jgi:plastocyanin
VKREHLFPVIVGATYLAAALGGFASQNPDAKKPEAKTITVKLKSLGYDPKKLEIHVGDSVVWTNDARTKHTATSDDDGKTFDTDEIEPGQSSKPVKFEKAGEFKYHCKVHGKAMSGTIVVKGVEEK